MSQKTVLGVHPAYRDDIDDLTTRRPVPGPRIQQVDPFLFLNHHGPRTYPPNNRGLPFGPHPHRGFETVTFILEGELMHRDSAGYESVIRAGGVQWMTAGRGIIHAELSPEAFKRSGGPLEILQLWLNLPSRLKMSPPDYHGLQADQIPVVETEEGARVCVIAGEWGGVRGPIRSLTGVMMTTVSLAPGGRVEFSGAEGRNVFCYVVDGSAKVNGHPAPAHALIQLGLEGDHVRLESDDGVRLLFGHGEPIGEPVFAFGPFVMNTEQEIRQAIRDYQAGLFGPPMA